MKIRKSILLVLIITVAFCLLTTCSQRGKKERGDKESQEATKPVKGSNPVVATVANKEIHVDEFKTYLNTGPVRRFGRVSERAVKSRLKQMLTAEALYQEAMRQKLDQDPDVQRRIRQMIVQKLLEENVDKPIQEKEITEEELQAYFTEHKNEFSRPEQVRVADIFIAVPDGADKKQKEEKKELAKKILAEVQKDKNGRFTFSRLIRKYSDRPRQYRMGDTGFFDREGKPIGLDKALVDAAFQLKKTGQVADKIVETPDGFHVIMLTGRRSAIKRDLKEIAPMLKRRIRREKLQERRKQFIEEVKKKSNITVDEQVLAEVVKEMNEAQKGTSVPSNRPKPGKRGNVNVPPPFPQK